MQRQEDWIWFLKDTDNPVIERMQHKFRNEAADVTAGTENMIDQEELDQSTFVVKTTTDQSGTLQILPRVYENKNPFDMHQYNQ